MSAALIAAEPDRFLLARPSDARFNWIDVRMATVGRAEMREFITEALEYDGGRKVTVYIPPTPPEAIV